MWWKLDRALMKTKTRPNSRNLRRTYLNYSWEISESKSGKGKKSKDFCLIPTEYAGQLVLTRKYRATD